MATPEKIEQALETLHQANRNLGTPGSRRHKDGLLEVASLISALTHPCCGSCGHLDINPYWGQGRDQVSLICEKKHSPRNLWIDWTPGDAIPMCIDCTDPEGRPVEGR